ncbi:type III secretion system inner membrane ring subunit SctD [Pseudomonas sp. PH1b]|uniref:type III secretion system inner membrane ring subunit SctD n=1 Tax=Pseudomonas sp. PH1b TaxID=1397282 RepID=UPI000468B3B9|nr:type III secretion system inner membrane ring subunit SctD [Pseudomonas sp. PH1b]BFD44940.1 SctD family type III secretion system inner membrane ring subunit PscD [Pseudomonas sp. FFPRI_1]
MSWKIRFYSGLNQGVEVPLAEGRVVIGSDPLQADLVLVDEGIAPVHLVLEVDPQGVRLLEWAEGHQPLQEGQPLAGGSTLQALVRQACGPLLWAFCAQERQFFEQLPMAANPQERRAPAPRAYWAGRLMLTASLLLLVGLVGLLGAPWSSGSSGMSSEDPLVALRMFLRDRQFQSVQVGEPQANGSITLTGYLEDNRTRLSLQQYLERSALTYRLDVRSMEEIRQGVEFILQKFGYRQVRTVNADQPGWIRLTGELALEDDHWLQIDNLLKADVPGLLGVENRVRLAGSHLKRLDQMLADFGLEAALAYQDKGERIELRGALDEAQLNQFYKLQREFRQEFGARPALELLSRNKRASSDELEFVVRSVSLGKLPYVVLGDGQKYPVDASTPQGVRVLAINADAVVVSRGKQQFIINLKGEPLNDDGFGGASARR